MMAAFATSVRALADAVVRRDRRALARAITLVESTRNDHRCEALELLDALPPPSDRSLRVAVSGVPGVGKSTFIEALGEHAIDEGRRLAVLAIDPSSALSGGSIMGDKTRMQELARNPQAFVRPSPTGLTLGGVARRTREAIVLCEAAGFDLVLVETVGVGQSEIAASEMTDLFLLLLMPGSGDELQGIKRGIMELADIVLINKADGELEDAATRAAAEYGNALRLLKSRSSGWSVPVDVCSSVSRRGIEQAWRNIERFQQTMTQSGMLRERRAAQGRRSMWAEAVELLRAKLESDPAVLAMLPALESAVARGELAPHVAAARLTDAFLSAVASARRPGPDESQ